MHYLGVDPGLEGAIGVLGPDGEFIAVYDMPIAQAGKRVILPAELAELFNPKRYTGGDGRYTVGIEKAQSFPKQGSASAFNYGTGFGMLLGICAALWIPYTLYHPAKWTGVMLQGMGEKGKEASRVRAQQLWPKEAAEGKLTRERARKLSDGRCEALLIANYHRLQFSPSSS